MTLDARLRAAHRNQLDTAIRSYQDAGSPDFVPPANHTNFKLVGLAAAILLVIVGGLSAGRLSDPPTEPAVFLDTATVPPVSGGDDDDGGQEGAAASDGVDIVVGVTPTPTATPTVAPSPTNTPTNTPTPSADRETDRRPSFTPGPTPTPDGVQASSPPVDGVDAATTTATAVPVVAAESTPTPTVVPEVTAPAPTVVPTPSVPAATPVPTATPTAVIQATATPAATATVVPSPTATSTPAATPTPSYAAGVANNVCPSGLRAELETASLRYVSAATGWGRLADLVDEQDGPYYFLAWEPNFPDPVKVEITLSEPIAAGDIRVFQDPFTEVSGAINFVAGAEQFSIALSGVDGWRTHTFATPVVIESFTIERTETAANIMEVIVCRAN